jgi:hypothetical protein
LYFSKKKKEGRRGKIGKKEGKKEGRKGGREGKKEEGKKYRFLTSNMSILYTQRDLLTSQRPE